MPSGPGAGANFRARVKALQEQLARQNQETEAEEAARRLDADEVGQRADRRKAERERETARSDEPPRGD